MKTTYENGMRVLLDDECGVLSDKAKGWWMLTLDDGSTKKIREKAIVAIVTDDVSLEDDEDDTGKMANTLNKYREKYEATVSHSGRLSLNNGDEVADLLAGLEPVAVITTAERLLGLESGELVAKYDRLNNGQKRMNAGNRIRSAIKRGDYTVDDLKKATKAA